MKEQEKSQKAPGFGLEIPNPRKILQKPPTNVFRNEFEEKHCKPPNEQEKSQKAPGFGLEVPNARKVLQKPPTNLCGIEYEKKL